MVERLLDQGHEVVVWNRTREKMKPLETRGAEIASTAPEAIQDSPVTILMLTDVQAIREVLFASVQEVDLDQRTIVQMGTIAPSESRAMAHEVQERGGRYVEAPVLGSIGEARNGTLLIMVGGEDAVFKQWQSLLKCLGTQPKWVGSVGSASMLKLALNQLIASHISAFSLSLGLIQHSGCRVEDFMEILKQSALVAPMYEKKLPRLRDRQYDNPNFPTTHLLKDVNLVIQEATAAGLATTGLEGIRTLLEETLEKGLRDVDYSSIFETIVPSSK
jgi:3-hydroxyisobutyrate dehydrogenase